MQCYDDYVINISVLLIMLCVFVNFSNRPVSLSKHKRSLEKLKKADPAFYKFLEKEDKDLLNVDVSDDEDDDDEDDVDDEDDEDDSEDEGSGKENGKKGRLHKLPAKLEVRQI